VYGTGPRTRPGLDAAHSGILSGHMPSLVKKRRKKMRKKKHKKLLKKTRWQRRQQGR
jgi:Mitochondrial domain of unknown function (DUF1713)